MGDQMNHVFAIIVGGGMSGIQLAATLLRQKNLGRHEFMIFDKWNDYGGVWEANKYPGAACDVPSHAYVIPFALKADWSREYAQQPEIQAYYASVARQYRLNECTTFNTNVVSATWDTETLMYDVVVENTKTGVKTTWKANVVVDCGGQFWRPKYADIPGKENFKGVQWHTSQWRSDIDLSGKRVAMIGTGPSTAQVAPRIQPLVKELILYQRSATYVVPRNDKPQPTWRQNLLKWLPPLLWAYHFWWYMSIEGRKKMWLSYTKEQAESSAYALSHLQNQVRDPIIREKLTPTHQFGCKRILVLDDWYPIFNQPNVKLITEKPVRITEDGIISKPPDQLPAKAMENDPVDAYPSENIPPPAKELNTKFDVLLWGTGFDMTHQGSHFQLYGKDGLNLEQYWGDKPEAYYATQVNGFPNFMMMLGPNSANFWSNLTTVARIQAKYNCNLIGHIKKQCQNAPYALNVTEKAQREYNIWIQGQIGPVAVISPNCHNYYTNDKGELTFWNPFHGWYYAWRLMSPMFRDFDIFQSKKSKLVGFEA